MLHRIEIEKESTDSLRIIQTDILGKISDTDPFSSFYRPIAQIDFLHEQFEECGFAGAILSDQSDFLSSGNSEIDMIDKDFCSI